MDPLAAWLQERGLERYLEVLAQNEVDLEALCLLTEQDLQALGLPLGPRRKLLYAIAEFSAVAAPTPAAAQSNARPSPLQTDGERRQATVLFSDLAGYTAMTEKLDPELVADTVGRIKAEAVRIVEFHGGIVNQFVGDEVLALFGIPVAHEDDPVRAVRAALALHRMVKEMSPAVETRIGHTLRLHTGIDTGLVVTNLRDQRDGTYGITGDAVNTGARLAAQATADEVWVSPGSHERIADYFETVQMGAVSLKGKAEPLIPYRIVRASQTETRFEAAQRRGLTGYTGRATELASLRACLDNTIAGEGQFAAVIGEAGAGKSRLVFEFRNSLPRDRIKAVQGRCQSYGSETPYLPFLDALRRALDLREDDNPEQLLEKILVNVRAVDPGLERFLPHYLHLLSVATEQHTLPATLQGAERKRAFEEALCAIFTLAAKRRPLVVALEDWHWVDATSNTVLKRLVALISEYPIMIVVLCRPEYDLSWAAPAQLTAIVLKSLSIADSGAMACTALKVESMPQELRVLIHDRTVGNPLFIEEVCHTLIEEKIITVSNGQAKLVRGIETVHLPQTVQAVIRSRVDRLDPETREVLQIASVIGREFARTLLERVVAATDRLSTTLEALSHQDLIRQVRVLPEPEYIFKHVLTQVVVYETLLLMRRQALHELVAQAIEEVYAGRLEEYYESLAYHYQHSDNQEKALRYLELAGDKANAQYVLEQTVKNYRQATQLLRELDKTPERMHRHIDIAVKWALLIVPSAEVVDALTLAKEYAQGLHDNERFAKATSLLGQTLLYRGDFHAAVTELQQVIDMEPLLHDKGRVGSSYRCLAQTYVSTSEDRGIADCLKRAKPLVHASADRFEESCCSYLEGWWLGSIGRYSESLSKFEEGIHVARLGGERSIEVWNWTQIGQTLAKKGDWSEALRALDEAIALGERIENIWAVNFATIVRCYTTFMVSQDPSAIEQMIECLGWKEQHGAILNIASLHGLCAQALLLAARTDEATTYVTKALHRLNTGSAFGAAPLAYRTRALITAANDLHSWDVITADLDKSLSTAASFGYQPEIALTQLAYARLLIERHEPTQARAYLSEAEALFSEMEMSWWMEQAAKLQIELAAT